MRLFIDSAGGMRPRAERKAYDTWNTITDQGLPGK